MSHRGRHRASTNMQIDALLPSLYRTHTPTQCSPSALHLVESAPRIDENDHVEPAAIFGPEQPVNSVLGIAT